MESASEMSTYIARLESFQQTHQLSKRRASSQSTRRKNGQTADWPHERPRPEDLARAGFYFRPTLDNPDNVQCFFCDVKLDGWEPEDNALSEHVAHSSTCSWARAFSVAQLKETDAHDPMDEEHVRIRTDTFTHNVVWPHESKRGWKCKTKKMVEAGWIFDPSPDYEDGVTCCYCELSLDGWEPKDDPREEHQKRAPDCAFFSWTAQHHSAGHKPKSKGKSRSRASTASKVSRLSTQSSISAFTDVAGLGETEDVVAEDLDDTIASTDTVISQANTKAKRITRPKQATKKGRKPAGTNDAGRQSSVQYPELTMATEKSLGTASTEDKMTVENVGASVISKSVGRKDESRKEKALKHDADDSEDKHIDNEVSAQLQEELDQSISLIAGTETSPVPPNATKAKRGVKRMSNGSEKDAGASSIPADMICSVGTASQNAVNQTNDNHADEYLTIPEPQTKQTKSKKATKRATKSKKSSSARSSQATVTKEEPGKIDKDQEDLDRDEREIEEELARMAVEVQVQACTDGDLGRTDEYEASPSRPSRHSREIAVLEAEIVATGMALKPLIQPTPSPSASDKENVPSSSARAMSVKRTPISSPTKTVRIPLAPGTPNRASARPTKQTRTCLTSVIPWEAVDLDHVLIGSPAPTPRTLGERLAGVAGALSSPEKRMTVEEWVRWRAAQGETELRQRCEHMVGCFEREGMRALQSLEALQTL